MSDRVLLITGASSGIGLATALRAGAAGDHLVLLARDTAALDGAADRCRAAGAGSVLSFPTDVGDDEAVAAAVRTALGRHDRLDAVVHSAGVVSYGRTEDVPAEVFDGVIRTNLTGSVNVARHVLPVMRDRGQGVLVLVGSVIGHITVPTMSPYVLSKAGVRALARQLRVENRDLPGVRIEYVSPGGVDTPVYQQAGNYAGHEGRPPFPVASPERTARQVLARVERHHRRSQLSLANEVIRFGHTVLPAVYDALVTPLFTVAATDLARPVGPGTGNVLAPQPQRHALHGDQGNALLGLGRNLMLHTRRVLGR
ncbi:MULTISPECIES: SDR family NAD(P)-dependent oxidoreductase [unclassified Nocardioides]|uniref:SDR family NAD(P)-dependent oxidoreductase n=1 Tax=unclassified Nocardioides TaxID=2615069 RepID=UPI00301531D5